MIAREWDSGKKCPVFSGRGANPNPESILARGVSPFPIVGEQVLDLVERMRGKTCEDIPEVGERVDTVEFGNRPTNSTCPPVPP